MGNSVPNQTPTTLFKQFLIDKMKGLFVIAILLLPYLTNACICNGITEATCTSPCYKCGLCNKKCCGNLFGRKEVEIDEKDRFIYLCGRNLVESRNSTDLDPAIEAIEKESFNVCDMNGDNGLNWGEVSDCITTFGAFFQNLEFPREEDFHLFDVNNDGVLYYEEWLQSLA